MQAPDQPFRVERNVRLPGNAPRRRPAGRTVLLDPHIATQLDATPSGLAWFVESLGVDDRHGRPGEGSDRTWPGSCSGAPW